MEGKPGCTDPHRPDLWTIGTRTEYVNELASEIAQEVWRRLSGNGSLHVNIDTDVECYGPWDPHGMTTGEDTHADRVADAQSWMEYFVRSAINRLADRDLLNVPEKPEEPSRTWIGFRRPDPSDSPGAIWSWGCYQCPRTGTNIATRQQVVAESEAHVCDSKGSEPA